MDVFKAFEDLTDTIDNQFLFNNLAGFTGEPVGRYTGDCLGLSLEMQQLLFEHGVLSRLVGTGYHSTDRARHVLNAGETESGIMWISDIARRIHQPVLEYSTTNHRVSFANGRVFFMGEHAHTESLLFKPIEADEVQVLQKLFKDELQSCHLYPTKIGTSRLPIYLKVDKIGFSLETWNNARFHLFINGSDDPNFLKALEDLELILSSKCPRIARNFDIEQYRRNIQAFLDR